MWYAVRGGVRADLRANQPSSSSLLVRAGSGAPGASPSVVGSLRLPSSPKGLYCCSLPNTELGLLVVAAGCSRRDQPRLFMLSLKEDEAMAPGCGKLDSGVKIR